ncbi:MAG: family 16 glycosylhydrolase [Pseudomonadota bacterium]
MATSFKLNDKDYVLTFNDEFNDESLRLFDGQEGGIWATTFSPGWDDLHFLSQNNEQQYYVDPNRDALTSPFAMSNGNVEIKATELTAEQSVLAQGQGYSSGLLTSEMTFSADSGYVEIRADMPGQQGFWSSLWMLPVDGGWTSEIDIAEVLGHDPDTLYTNVWEQGVPDSEAITVDGSDGFHTYGLLWTEGLIQWYFDGDVVREVNASLNEDMYLALSLAIGGFAGDTDESTDFDDVMKIDYVRVYELEDDPDRNDAIEMDGFVPNTNGFGSNLSEMLRGTMFDDVLDAGAGRDKVYGRQGDDLIAGGTGNDRLFGGADEDTLDGSIGHDRLFGGYGSDLLEGGSGTDKLFGFEGADEMYGGRGYDRLFGEKGDDVLYGNEQRDDLFGGKGSDELHGGMGTDELFGNADDDMLFGGSGADKLVGGAGSDTLSGDNGDDNLWGGTFKGDNVTDRFIYNSGGGKDVIHDFTVGVDLVDLSDMNLVWVQLLEVASYDGWSTRLDFASLGGGQNDALVLVDVTLDDLNAEDFILNA